MNITMTPDASESDFIDGEIEKKNYRRRWVTNVKKIPSHPFNHGIHMDTHHLISKEAVNLSKLGKLLVKKGFDINDLNNLVGFPATLPGACQLKTQLHRGDHIFKPPGEEPYHDEVSKSLVYLEVKIERCYGKTKKRETSHDIHQLLNPVAKNILKKITRFQLPLTELYLNFKHGNNIGCGNCFEVKDARFNATACEHGRAHYKQLYVSGVDYRYQSSNAYKKIIMYSESWTPKVTK
ncbi:AHH domain-containing protein [Photobacterium kagoshimensis]|uniref:AHH domain-containing protein n=1 Tax=Photobacterium kagoshimensis TaxID=2910242 RepID=UPI003D140BE2